MKNLFKLCALVILLLSASAFCQITEIYVSDANNFSPPWKILKYDENGENPQTFINTNLAWPQDIVFLEDQHVVLISNLNSGRITKYNSSTGEYIENFATGISGPTRMKIGADSLLYVLQWDGNGRVLRYQLDGTFMDEFTSDTVYQSIGIDWDSNGNLYVSSYTKKRVKKFDQNGNYLGLFATTNLSGPTNIWIDDNDELLVIDYLGAAVKRFDADGDYLNNFITGLGNAEGVDFFPNGNILIGNGVTSSVKMFDSSGNYIEDLIPSGSGGLVTPNAVVLREVTTLPVQDDGDISVNTFELRQNYPNPFNPSTNIQYTVGSRQFVTLKVYDVLGNEIATLVNEEKDPGSHTIQFSTSSIKHLPSSGIYFYQLQADSFIETKKMILLK
jgi:hypothetical protein